MTKYYTEKQVREAINTGLNTRMIMAALDKFGIDTIDVSRSIMEELSKQAPLTLQINLFTDLDRDSLSKKIMDELDSKFKKGG